jgi:hypothetical protein
MKLIALLTGYIQHGGKIFDYAGFKVSPVSVYFRHVKLSPDPVPYRKIIL